VPAIGKLDDQQLGWMAADRAQVLASGSGDPLAAAEAPRNLAVLARKAGWHNQAASIALAAAASSGLEGADPRLTADQAAAGHRPHAAGALPRHRGRTGWAHLVGQAASPTRVVAFLPRVQPNPYEVQTSAWLGIRQASCPELA
jgi:hypothetical protein